MSDESRVRERVATWQRWHADGTDVSAEDLCGDAPELTRRVAAELDLLRKSAEMEGTAERAVTPIEQSVEIDPAWERLVEPAGGRAPKQIGDYRVLGVLGQGGMGTVYLAEDVRLGRRAAIKTMRPEAAASATARARFVREARAAAAVEHDHIVPIWQVGEAADGTPFIAMPALRGETLESLLHRTPRPALHLTLKIGHEIAAGLAAAHQAGLIHRDVKPVNVWLEGDPASDDDEERVRRCKILDFGLVRTTATGDARLTTSGTLNGTPPYIAPEQLRGKEIDFRADLFALGVVLYRMATGEVPFKGESLVAIVYQVASHHPPTPQAVRPDVPTVFSDMIMKLLHKEPEGRPAAAAGVARELRRLAEKARPRRADQTVTFLEPPPSTATIPRPPAPPPPAFPVPKNPASGPHAPPPPVLPSPRSGFRAQPPMPAIPAPPPPAPVRHDDDDDDSFTWNRHRPPPEPAVRPTAAGVSGGLIVAAGLAGLLLAVVAVLVIRSAGGAAPPTEPDGGEPPPTRKGTR